MNIHALNAAITRLYVARKSAKQAKDEFRSVAEKAGRCDGYTENQTRCFEDKILTPEEWCNTCKTKQPFWTAYRKATTEKANALKALMRYAKQRATK